jgi:hypothetical protein
VCDPADRRQVFAGRVEFKSSSSPFELTEPQSFVVVHRDYDYGSEVEVVECTDD